MYGKVKNYYFFYNFMTHIVRVGRSKAQENEGT